MSDSSDHPQSDDEGNRSTAPNSSPPDGLPYDPFRQSPWTSGHFASLTGRTSRRDSPREVDPPHPRSPFDSRGIDPRSPTSIDDYTPPQQLFSSPPTTTYSPPTAPDITHTSASGQLSSVGTRPEFERPDLISRSYPPGMPEGLQRLEIEDTRTRNPPRSQRPYRDEFDGPSQLLSLPLPDQDQGRAQPLPPLPISLSIREQDEVARRANDILAQCAFHFVAKYQFPIPIERDKRYVRQPSDREWTEWAYLLKRLATKRRIPARVLFDNQIKQLVTTLENSIAVRQTMNTRTEPPMPRQPRDDRYMLQLVSSGLQVAKILMDSVAMEQLSQLYVTTEALILERRNIIGAGRPTRGGRGGRGGNGIGGGGGGGGGGGSLGGGGVGGGSIVGVVY